MLTEIDPTALGTACVAWTLADRPTCPGAGAGTDAELDPAQLARQLTGLAMDGKCPRGARRPDGSMSAFMAAVIHDRPVVLAQQQIPDKTSEIGCVATLLADLRAVGWDLTSTVVTWTHYTPSLTPPG